MSVPIDLTVEMIDKVADELLDEYGSDFHYSNPNIPGWTSLHACHYVHYVDGENVPGCIVGHILNRLGVPLEEMDTERFGNTPADNLLESLADRGIISLESVTNGRISGYLKTAQYKQDTGNHWGYAIACARGAI